MNKIQNSRNMIEDLQQVVGGDHYSADLSPFASVDFYSSPKPNDPLMEVRFLSLTIAG